MWDDVEAAWKLYREIRSRITSERDALAYKWYAPTIKGVLGAAHYWWGIRELFNQRNPFKVKEWAKHTTLRQMMWANYVCPRCFFPVTPHPMNGYTWKCYKCGTIYFPWHIQAAGADGPACCWPKPVHDINALMPSEFIHYELPGTFPVYEIPKHSRIYRKIISLWTKPLKECLNLSGCERHAAIRLGSPSLSSSVE